MDDCYDDDDCCETVAAGAQGLQGFQGQSELRGFQGDVGFQADSVIQGTQGFQGVVGDALVGSMGNFGWQGDSFVGFPGPQGPQGLLTVGTQGAIGNFGFQGYQGTSTFGIQGPQGFANAGMQGIRGAQGFQGLEQQGPQGLAGLQSGPASSYTFKGSASINVSSTPSQLIPTAVFPGFPGVEYTVLFNASLQYPLLANFIFQLQGSSCTQTINTGTIGAYYPVSLSSKQSFSSGTQYIGPVIYSSSNAPNVQIDYILQVIQK